MANAGTIDLLSGPSPRTRWRILVVESNPQDADALTRRLQRHGHEVSSVGTGGKALQEYDDTDRALLDLELADLGGRGSAATCEGTPCPNGPDKQAAPPTTTEDGGPS